MGSILSILIFIIIFFLYLHLIDQYKNSNDLELYEMDYTNLNELNETCNIKQPIVFHYQNVNPQFFELLTNDILENKKDNLLITDQKLEQFILECSSALILLHNDKKNSYYTENNDHFIYESDLQNIYETNDDFLKPPFTVKTKYDIHFATKNATTPLKYHNYHRHFLSVHSGRIRVKLIPPKFKKHLLEKKDYDNYLFHSPIDLWDIQKKYAHILDKIKFLEFDIYPGSVLYIPPNWWYTIQFLYEDDVPTLCSSITYITAMNVFANLKHYFLYFIQQSNTKIVKTRTIAKDELQSTNSNPDNEEEPEEKEHTEEEKEEEEMNQEPPLQTASSDI